MWQPQTVERALFRWAKWRKSIIDTWMLAETEPVLLLKQMALRVDGALENLGLPASLWLKLYWMCCVTSDYNLDYEASLSNIVIPAWFPPVSFSVYKLEPGIRMCPPRVLDEGDIEFDAWHEGYWGLANQHLFYPGYCAFDIFLPSGHELYLVLNKLRGRPKKSRNVGRLHYSDRLAAQCFALKDGCNMTYVEIAERLNLRITKPWESRQSDVAVHLVGRGGKLLGELSC